MTNGRIAYTVAKSASTASITAPGTITYTMTVTNTGGALLTGTTFSDSLAQGVTAKTLTSGPTFVSGDSVNAGVLDPGEAWIYTATYNVSQADIDDGGTFANIFTFDTAQSSPQNSNTALTTVTRTPNLNVLKRVQTVPPDPADGRPVNHVRICGHQHRQCHNVRRRHPGNGFQWDRRNRRSHPHWRDCDPCAGCFDDFYGQLHRNAK